MARIVSCITVTSFSQSSIFSQAKKKAPTEARADDRKAPPGYSLGGSLSSGGLDGGLGHAHSGV